MSGRVTMISPFSSVNSQDRSDQGKSIGTGASSLDDHVLAAEIANAVVASSVRGETALALG